MRKRLTQNLPGHFRIQTISALERTRTSDPQLRKLMLYPLSYERVRGWIVPGRVRNPKTYRNANTVPFARTGPSSSLSIKHSSRTHKSELSGNTRRKSCEALVWPATTASSMKS